MKDINEIINTLLETAKKFDLNYSNTAVKDTEGIYDLFLDVRIEKHRDNPYGLINTIPRPFPLNDIGAKEE